MDNRRTEGTMKQINARTEKWRQMLKGDIFADPALLKKRVRKGVPACLRGLVWPRIINLHSHRKTTNLSYKNLLKMDTPHGQEICKDIPRTFPTENPKTIHRSLYNVLKALSLVFPELGYCQGMNFLTMRLIQIMDDETVFWVMHYVLNTYEKVYWNYRCPEAMQIQNVVISELVKRDMPQIHRQLQEQNIPPLLYTPGWLITLYSRPLPAETFYRVFECMLLEGEKIVYRAALTMLKFKEQLIASGQAIMEIADNSIYQQYSPDQFLDSMFSFRVRKADIASIQKGYTESNRKQIEAMRSNANEMSRKREKNAQMFKYPQGQSLEDYQLDLQVFNRVSFRFVQFL